jgi:hypothetical protein
MPRLGREGTKVSKQLTAVADPALGELPGQENRWQRPHGAMGSLFTLAVLGIVLVTASAVAAAPPPPPPKFWSPARCEATMRARPLAPPQQVRCVGVGGPSACRWTSAGHTRVYSEFVVFTRYDHTNVRGVGFEPGVVRSFTLATRARPGFHRVVHHWGDGYAGWPADFFMARRRLLATGATPERFRAIVAPVAARLVRDENASGCRNG